MFWSNQSQLLRCRKRNVVLQDLTPSFPMFYRMLKLLESFTDIVQNSIRNITFIIDGGSNKGLAS